MSQLDVASSPDNVLVTGRGLLSKSSRLPQDIKGGTSIILDSEVSPTMSDEESADATSPAGSIKSQDSATKSEDASIAALDSNVTGEGASTQAQKRRRVTRACDECRRKKIKCDGKHPCTHCAVYSYECTYDKPSNRRRNPAPQYIEALETRLQRAEVLLRKFMPDVNLNDPTLDPAVQQEFQNRERVRAQAAQASRDQQQLSDDPDEHIMSMIETIGQLDLSEGGEWDFHGASSGAVFLKRMKEHFRGLLGQETGSSALFRPSSRPPGILSLEGSRDSHLGAGLRNYYDLPPREHVRHLCYLSLNCATCLLRFVHVPSFYETLGSMYDKEPGTFSKEDHKFLGLLYSVLALGCMYNTSSEHGNTVDYKAAMEEGLKYYSTARSLLQDITECRDIMSLQALLFIILFLQSTSNISNCYVFVGIAMRASLRMGLHRDLPHAGLTPIERESRRRIFYVTRHMDISISALLGFPILLRDEDVDQPLPSEADDEYITSETIVTPPSGTTSFFEAFNAHARLTDILAKVLKHIYPMKGSDENTTTTYTINYSTIKGIECELQDWLEQLPAWWRPSPEGPIEVVRVRILLRFAYAHVQMMLYRPFLHYVSPRLSAGKTVDERFYACAAAGISVSRNIVHIGMEIQKQATLIGPYWFVQYTQFFAILALVFYALENPEKQGSSEILADAKVGREVILSLSQKSMAADRVGQALKTLFESLPDRSRKGKSARPVPTKKRSRPKPTDAKPMHVAAEASSRSSEELNRPHSGPHDHVRNMNHHRGSFDTAPTQLGHSTQPFVQNFPEMIPLDMAPRDVSPEANGTPSSSHHSLAGFPMQQSSNPNMTPLYKMEGMMFPSGDPFEYPSQPIALHAPQPHASATQQPEAVQYYMPNTYDNLDGQLLGPIPPYLVQPSQGHGLDMSTPQMYAAPARLDEMHHHQGQPPQQLTHQHHHQQHQHQQQQRHQHQHQHQHQHHQQQQQQHQHQQQPHNQQQRQRPELDEYLVADPNMDIFQHHPYNRPL